MAGKNFGSAIEWYGPEQVLSGYDLHCKNREQVYYSVWQGNAIKFPYKGGDEGEGKDLLSQNLDAWKQAGTSAQYTLAFHPALDKDGNLTAATPIDGSGNFRVNETGSYQPRGMAAVTQTDPRLDKILELMQQQNDRLQALEEGADTFDMEEVEEEEEEEPDEVGRVIGRIGEIDKAIENSPRLAGLYDDIRYGFRFLMKKAGVQIPEINHGINGTQKMADQEPGQQKDGPTVMRELVIAWPELPALLTKMHQILQRDPDEFRYVTKKVNEKINDL